ncbi:MAG TPA: RNA-binding S4 domain-containing protein [Saprospiraceae bacterium]|nr:RNA-binding S4 domain-containing protein [Saprospiraceae bacterium]
MDKVRIDKWLWSVRIYKSRSMATDACRANQVKIDRIVAKASSMVQRGCLVDLRKDGFHLSFKVLDLIDKRVSAPLAQVCYEDLTPDEERNKYKEWFIGKARPEVRGKGVGRPTKKERRELDEYKGKPKE